MMGASINNVGINPYINSYNSTQNRSDTKPAESFESKINEVMDRRDLTGSNKVKYEGIW